MWAPTVTPIAFASDVKPLRSIDEIDREPWGANTYLDRAIEHVIAKNYDDCDIIQ